MWSIVYCYLGNSVHIPDRYKIAPFEFALKGKPLNFWRNVITYVLAAFLLPAGACPLWAQGGTSLGEVARELRSQRFAEATTPTKSAAAEAEFTTPGIQSPETITFAVLAPLTGPVPYFGAMVRDAARLAVEEWNAKGGVLGKQIVPIIRDSRCLPEPAEDAAKKVINTYKVHYLIGEVCSKASIPISEIANAKKVIQIAVASTDPALTMTKDGKAKDYVYRACFIDPLQGAMAAKFALGRLRAKAAFIMLDPESPYVKGLAEVFEREFTKGGGRIVGKETYATNEMDFSEIVAKIAAARPEIIYLPDYYNIANRVIEQVRKKGIRATFIGGDGWDSDSLDLEITEGSFFTNHYYPHDPRPEVQNFVRTFSAKYKDNRGRSKIPDALAALAYDATNLLLTAIKDAGVDDTAKVRDALNKITFNGVTGRLTFDANHNPVKPGVMLAVKDGRIVVDSMVNP